LKASIIFIEQYLQLNNYPHADATVMEANIAGWRISRVLVDSSSSTDIIFINASNKNEA
jgi:hypothetical protein